MAWLTDFASSVRGKWVVIALWLVLGAVLVPIAPSIGEVTESGSAAFVPEDSESTRAQEFAEEQFAEDGAPAIVVFYREGGLSEDDEQAIAGVVEWAQSEDAPDLIEGDDTVSTITVPEASEELLSEDGTTTSVIIPVAGDTSSDAFGEAVDAISEQLDDVPIGLEANVSGPAGLSTDLTSVFDDINLFLTLVTVSLVLVLLIIIYRSPVIALVPLAVVGLVVAIATAAGALLAQELGFPVNAQAQGIMTVLLFGAGTDYCLFITSRYREELARTEDKHLAMRDAMRGVGGAVASSAGTILVACLILLLAALRSTSSLGPILSIAIALILVAALTLVPALIAVLGRFAFWPFRPVYDPHTTARKDDGRSFRIWGRIAAAVTERPGMFLAGSLVLFLIFSGGLLRYTVTYDEVTSLPEGTESREGFERLFEAFPGGEATPTEIYLTLDGERVYDQLSQLEELTHEIAEFDGVVRVSSAANPFGLDGPVGADDVAIAAEEVPDDVREVIDAGEDGPENGDDEAAGEDADEEDPVAQAIGLYTAASDYVSDDLGSARIEVVFDGNPYGIEAIERIGPFRETVQSFVEGLELVADQVLVGGETAVSYDTMEATERDIALLLPLILAAITIILGVLLRSVVAAAYLFLTIIVSYAATLGLSVLAFEFLFGYEGIGSTVQLLLFVFLVALGIDYNIYLMARIREETAQSGLRDGVRRALTRTGGVITSAGIILAGTFSALMTLPLRDLFQLGFAVALGVLLDTFVVRTIMVPSIVMLLGRWNWWPSKRFRGAEEPAPRAADAQD